MLANMFQFLGDIIAKEVAFFAERPALLVIAVVAVVGAAVLGYLTREGK